MRGDSLRDLYAKTLAVVGLALLAAIGALVDYWPTGIRYPALAGALDRPAVPVVLDAEPLAIGSTGRVNAALVASPTPTDALLADASLPTAPSLEVAPAVSEFGRIVALSALASAPPDHRNDRVEMLSDPFALSGPVAVLARADEASADLWPSALDSFASGESSTIAADYGGEQDDERGFVADALHKTRTSIVRTGRWTGSSLVDAVKVVGSAVRRALPN